MSGLRLCESPRWHDGRLWFADWGARELIALDPEGKDEVVANAPDAPVLHRLAARRPDADREPDARLLPHGARRLAVPHADLGRLPEHSWNEIVVDGRGNAYVEQLSFDFATEEPRPGIIALVTPDGSVRQVADGDRVPERHGRDARRLDADRRRVLRPPADRVRHRRRRRAVEPPCLGGWASAPDGICLDAEGAVWTTVGEMSEHRLGRVREGGEVLGEPSSRAARASPACSAARTAGRCSC